MSADASGPARSDILRRTLAVILAGGEGTRLHPLTRQRAKPAVPFGGIYRIIDFTLSNCVNSGLRQILLLTQYKSLSLDRHVQQGWNILRSELDEFITLVPPQQRMVRSWYEGTADAIFHNIYSLQEHRPEWTLILSGDHAYQMDYAPMVEAHVESRADLTIAAIEVEKQDAKRFGVIQADATNRVAGFQEKPDDPVTLPGSETCLASMGVYVFSTDALVRRVLEDAKDRRSAHDFGKNIIPSMITRDPVFAYRMRGRNGRRPYWRDIGTLDSYWDVSMDLLQPQPPLDIFDRAWPLRTNQPHEPPALVADEGDRASEVNNSILAKGVRITSAVSQRSILSTGVTLLPGSEVVESILLDGVTVGERARIGRAIVDKSVVVPPGETIGYDRELDRSRYTLTENGIAVIPEDFIFA